MKEAIKPPHVNHESLWCALLYNNQHKSQNSQVFLVGMPLICIHICSLSELGNWIIKSFCLNWQPRRFFTKLFSSQHLFLTSNAELPNNKKQHDRNSNYISTRFKNTSEANKNKDQWPWLNGCAISVKNERTWSWRKAECDVSLRGAIMRKRGKTLLSFPVISRTSL